MTALKPDQRAARAIGERMIAERQREVAVSLKALHMMQEHHGNRYFSFECVSRDEEREWYAKAEKLIPREPTADGCLGNPKALAEHIAHYPRVRLCQSLDGSGSIGDWLLHERDRYLIVQALRKCRLNDE